MEGVEPWTAFTTNRLAIVQCVRRDAHQPGRRRGEEPPPRNQGGAAHPDKKTTANVGFEGSSKFDSARLHRLAESIPGLLKKVLKCESWPEVQP
jgi:hypothetical protein